MDEKQWLAERFEEHRAHPRGVASRMLGSLAEIDAISDAERVPAIAAAVFNGV